MHPCRAAVAMVCLTAVIVSAPPAAADPVDPIPGNGFFVVGPDIAPGLYRTGGSGSAWGVWINGVPTEDSMCVWFTYSTPINSSVQAFESRNCQPWTRVN